MVSGNTYTVSPPGAHCHHTSWTGQDSTAWTQSLAGLADHAAATLDRDERQVARREGRCEERLRDRVAPRLAQKQQLVRHEQRLHHRRHHRAQRDESCQPPRRQLKFVAATPLA